MTKDKLAAMATMYEDGATLTAVARAFGFSVSGTYSALRSHGVQTRRCGAHVVRAIDEAGERIVVQHYRDGASIKGIATLMGIGRKTVVNAMARQGEPLRSVADAQVARRMREDGVEPRVRSRHRQSDGYMVAILSLNHPRRGMASKTGRVLEHRLVVAEAMGRDLMRSETVHHKNGQRDDNRLENLQLRQGRHGNGHSMVCADCGSHNVVASELAVG